MYCTITYCTSIVLSLFFENETARTPIDNEIENKIEIVIEILFDITVLMCITNQ